VDDPVTTLRAFGHKKGSLVAWLSRPLQITAFATVVPQSIEMKSRFGIAPALTTATGDVVLFQE
jgi:hypothetical protein